MMISTKLWSVFKVGKDTIYFLSIQVEFSIKQMTWEMLEYIKLTNSSKFKMLKHLNTHNSSQILNPTKLDNYYRALTDLIKKLISIFQSEWMTHVILQSQTHLWKKLKTKYFILNELHWWVPIFYHVLLVNFHFHKQFQRQELL